MNNIIEKTYELIDVLDNSDMIKKLESNKLDLLNDNKILDLTRSSKNMSDNELILLKKKLYEHPLYKNYMDAYNELFYVVLEINRKIEELIGD